MYRLAKLGFTQSYTYFTWRNTKQELTEYFTELAKPAVADIFRPNLLPNTPDILHAYLQEGGRPAFIARAVLAATLGANWGVYGAAFELQEHAPREPGSEEYLNSEKYEVKQWDLNRADSLRDLLGRLNKIRREQPALQRNENLMFHPIDSDQLLAYSKRTADGSNVVLVVVNLDPRQAHSGWVELPMDQFRLGGGTFEVVDLLRDRKYPMARIAGIHRAGPERHAGARVPGAAGIGRSFAGGSLRSTRRHPCGTPFADSGRATRRRCHPSFALMASSRFAVRYMIT